MKSIKGWFVGLAIAIGLVFAVASTQALALTIAEAIVFDHNVSGVYRDGGDEGVVYIKRSGEHMVVSQVQYAPVLAVGSVRSPSSIEQTVNAADGNGDTYTLNLISSIMTVYDPMGGASRMIRVRGFTKRDLEHIDPIVSEAMGHAEQVAPSEQEGVSASFDCTNASTKTEKMICGNASIAKLDVELAQRYKSLMKLSSGSDEVFNRQEQREWLAERNKCAGAKCLIDSYGSRISELDTIIRYMNKPAEFR